MLWNEKKKKKNPETYVEYTIKKKWKSIVPVVKNILLTKIQVSKKTKQNRLITLSNGSVCGKKRSTFIKNKQLSND